MSKYAEQYTFEIKTTDPHVRKKTYTVSGDHEQIQKLKRGLVQVTSTETINGFSVVSTGYENGVLKHVATKELGNKTVKIESTESLRLPKFKPIDDIGEDDPYNPMFTAVQWVEIYDKKNRIDPEFTKIDEQQDQPYERKFGNSSIVSIADFLRDDEFLKMISKIGDQSA